MGQRSLYRRYRPQTFGEVVGQAHITRTLQNALIEGRLPHACLFSGPRGTGKTSTARILAKALNCEQAPTREPCNVCASCLAIAEGSSMDVVEIDAASHGSVEDARDLRERVAYASVGGTVKVYIIDECHMLTTAANNALLKVLEEPPSHVFFVFATTEPAKVLQTVQDRCQRYEFRAVGPAGAGLRITQVCEAEGVAIDPAAVSLLATRSAGSVRDALGLLDQAISYAGAKGPGEGPVTITAEEVARQFAAVPEEILYEAVDLISERDAGACFGFTDRLIRSGQEPREFLRALMDHLRSIFLVQHATAPQEILDVTDDRLDRLRAQANRFDAGDLLRILDLAGEAAIQLRQAVDPRLALEIAFARMARPDLHASPPSLLARIEQLERMAGLQGGNAPGTRSLAPPMAPPMAPPIPAPSREAPRPAPPPRQAPPMPVSAPPPPIPVAAAPTPAPAPPTTPPAAPTAPGDLDLDRIRRAWPGVMDQVRRRKIVAHAMLIPAQPVEFGGGELVLEYDARSKFHRDTVSDPTSGYLRILSDAFFEIFGARPTVRCIVGENVGPSPLGEPAPLVDDMPVPTATAAEPGTTPAAPAPPPASRPVHRDPIDLIREGFAAEIVEERR